MKIDITTTIRKISKKQDFWRVFILRTIGNFLVLSSIFMIVKTFQEPVFEEIRFFWNKYQNTQFVVAEDIPQDVQIPVKKKGLLAKALERDRIEIIRPKDPEFSIVIPKINANARVIKDVDPASKKNYLKSLKLGVAHAKGTALPGENGNIYMFAHSTDNIWNVGRYNAIFYLLYKLKRGDEINVFYKGQRFKYIVENKIIVDPNKVEYLTRKTDRELLTLQTCWPPGTIFQRLLVFARPAVE